ncbi:MAG: hypothetical protein JKY11_01375 [Alphaproteobacteria bacterium]|nr:hypothetical protein [Alphaproteobacteria bacterium]
MTNQSPYTTNVSVLRDIFKNCGIDGVSIYAGGIYIPVEGKVTFQNALYLAKPLNDDEFARADDAIDKAWLKDGSPLQNTTIHISSKGEEVSTWFAPKAIIS